jgi:hypothetical protein
LDRDLGFKAGTIWSFERVSHILQAKGAGLARQGCDAQSWCDQYGLELADEHALSDPGKSAYHAKHMRKGGPLDRFLELADRRLLGPDPVLLLEAVDRVSRMTSRDALERVFLRLINADVTIVTIEDNNFYNKQKCDEDGSALIMLVLKCQAAHEYSARLARRQRYNWEDVRKDLARGIVTRKNQNAPTWVSWDAKHERWELNEKAVPIARAMELLKNHGYSQTAKTLNTEGYKPMRAAKWTASNLASMIRSSHQIYGAVAIKPEGTWKPLERGSNGELWDGSGKFYDSRAQKGVVRGGVNEPKEIIEGVFPPILPKKEVEEVVSIIAARNRTVNRPGPNTKMYWIGRGLTRCVCGGSMSTCIGGHPPNSLIRYIACRSRMSAEECRRPYLPMHDVLAVVLSRLNLGLLLQLSGKGDVEGDAVRLRSQIERMLLKKDQINTERLNIQESIGRAAEIGGDAFTSIFSALQQRVADKDREERTVDAELAELRAKLSRNENPLALEAIETIIEPLKDDLINGTSTQDQRHQANTALKQLGIGIHIDSEAMLLGLSIGEGEINWQPIDFSGAYRLLAKGGHSLTTVKTEEGVTLTE